MKILFVHSSEKTRNYAECFFRPLPIELDVSAPGDICGTSDLLSYKYFILEEKLTINPLFESISINDMTLTTRVGDYYNFLEKKQKEIFQREWIIILRNILTWLSQEPYIGANPPDLSMSDQYFKNDPDKYQFILTVSHEIRSPLNLLLGMIDLLHETELDKDQEVFVKSLRESGRHLVSIVDDILTIGKMKNSMERIRPVEIDLREDLKFLIESSAASCLNKGLNFDFNMNLEENVVLGDKKSLLQIASNLIGNAVKFTEEGEIRVTLNSDKSSNIALIVEDTGIGIGREKIKKIFNEFYQVDQGCTKRYDGTGLGLCITKKLVETWGGSIEVKSESGNGTRFQVSLPCLPYTRDPRPRNEDTPHQQNQYKNIKILVADDNPGNRTLLKAYLAKTEHHVEFAEDGQQAIEMFETDPDFDMVFMDIQMPILDGFEATNQIRKIEVGNKVPTTPIIGLSANAFEDHIDLAEEIGFSGYLTKPISKSTFLKSIDLALSGALADGVNQQFLRLKNHDLQLKNRRTRRR